MKEAGLIEAIKQRSFALAADLDSGFERAQDNDTHQLNPLEVNIKVAQTPKPD